MKIELNDPSAPKGTLFSVYALGSLFNGESVEFTDEEVAFFEAEQGRSIQEAFETNQFIKISGKYVAKPVEDVAKPADNEEKEVND